ncbi:Retrovirus-related Pol polyprotein from transposon gypsy [Eumeta japonica]|uniref:Retrovirus-related Pol polyprotein from transposon gypsy n=1 Tax=Eumeta variegata TaxID=151549 RepID=A0A4C1TFC8_EUMVA|nr:Retrovirus-related Pol polyprotein from transposon gypsy [Eumeta japonica]
MSGHSEQVISVMTQEATQEAVRVFKDGINNSYIRSTLYGNPIKDLEHAYAVARTIEHDDEHRKLRLSYHNNEQKTNKPSTNSFRHNNKFIPEKHRRPNYEVPAYKQPQPQQDFHNTQQLHPEPMDTSSGHTEQRRNYQGFHSQPWKRMREQSGNFHQNRKFQRNNKIEAAPLEDDNDSTTTKIRVEGITILNAVIDIGKKLFIVPKETQKINYSIGDSKYELQINELMRQNNSIGPLPFTTTIEASIRTTTKEPIWTKQYPGNLNDTEFVNKEIEKLLEQGIIQKSYSPYNSPMLTVHKKGLDENGKPKRRMVIDFRKLNEHTITDRYIIPDVNVTLQNLGKAKYFTTLDLESGFHQIKIRKEDREKTAFCVNGGKREIQIFMHEVEYLGHIIKHNKITTDPEKIKAIEKFPTPTTLKDLRGFLGLTVIIDDSYKTMQIAKPLTAHLKGENAHIGKNKSSNTKIHLDQAAIEAVGILKLKLKEQVELFQPNYEKPFELTTDASNIAIGAVLILENRKAQCKIIQEYNPQLMQIEEGFILLDGINVIGNQTVSGTKLVSYSDEFFVFASRSFALSGKLLYLRSYADAESIPKAYSGMEREIPELLHLLFSP